MPSLSGYSGLNPYLESGSGSESGTGIIETETETDIRLRIVSYVCLSVIALFLCIIVILLIMIVISEFRENCILNIDNFDRSKKNKSKSFNLEMYNYTQTKLDSECSICIQKDNEKAVKLECGHTFHKGCIDKWVYECTKNINRQARCPLCNYSLNQFTL